MIDILFYAVGCLTLVFMGVCILALWDIHLEKKAKRKRTDWRLP